MTLGDRLRQARETKGWSLVDSDSSQRSRRSVCASSNSLCPPSSRARRISMRSCPSGLPRWYRRGA